MSTFIRRIHTSRPAALARFGMGAAGLAAALALAAPGQAQTTPPTSASAAASVPAATGLAQDLPRLLEQLVLKGYRDIREVERKSDKLVEVKARNASGQSVELYVDSRSGEVLREARDR